MVTRVGVATTAPAGTASFTLTLPSSYATGDRLIAFVAGKYDTTTVPTINQSWVLLQSGTGGTGSTGNDTGTTFWAVFGKDATSSSETAPTVTAGGTAPNSWEAFCVAYRPGLSKVWAESIGTSATYVQSASDTNTASTLTGTTGTFTNQPTAGDAIAAFGVTPTDTSTAIGSTTITATGLSGGTITTTTGYVENALGADTASVFADWTGFTGTQSAGTAISFTITSSTNLSGSVVAVALREQAGAGINLTAFQTSDWTTTSTPRTISVTGALTGDKILVLYGGDNSDALVSAATVSTTGGSTGAWTEPQEGFGATNQPWISSATATVTGDGTVTVSMARTQVTPHVWGGYALLIRNSGGIGTSNRSAPSSTETTSLTVSEGSAVAGLAIDWDALAVVAFSPSGAVDVHRQQDGSPDLSNYAGVWLSQSAGTRGYGIATSSTTLLAIIAVEILAGASDQAITPGSTTVTATPGTASLAMSVTPGSTTVTATPGTASLAMNVVPAPLTVSATPGTLTVTPGDAPIVPAPLTVTVTPGTVSVAQGITPAPLTVSVTPGSLGALEQHVTPGSTTVTATPGTLSVAQAIAPASLTVSVTPGSLGALEQHVTPGATTVSVTPGSASVAMAITPGSLTVTATPGTLSLSMNIVPAPLTITANAGTLVVSEEGAPEPEMPVSSWVVASAKHPFRAGGQVWVSSLGGDVFPEQAITPAPLTITASGTASVAIEGAPGPTFSQVIPSAKHPFRAGGQVWVSSLGSADVLAEQAITPAPLTITATGSVSVDDGTPPPIVKPSPVVQSLPHYPQQQGGQVWVSSLAPEALGPLGNPKPKIITQRPIREHLQTPYQHISHKYEGIWPSVPQSPTIAGGASLASGGLIHINRPPWGEPPPSLLHPYINVVYDASRPPLPYGRSIIRKGFEIAVPLLYEGNIVGGTRTAAVITGGRPGADSGVTYDEGGYGSGLYPGGWPPGVNGGTNSASTVTGGTR